MQRIQISTMLLLIAACGDSTSSGNASPVQVSGRVLAAENGKPLSEVTVVAPGNKQKTTDARGAFELIYSAEAKGAIKASSRVAAPVEKPAPRAKGYVELYVKAYDLEQEIDGATGGEASTAGGARLKVGADSLVSAKGKPAKTKLVLAAVNPKRATDLPSIPGNFDAQQSTEKRGKLAPKSPVYVSARDGDEELSLKDGQRASVDLPIHNKGRKANGDTLPLYRYDFERGLWVEEGSATEITSEAGIAIYRAQIGSLGWWTVGDFYDQLTCLRGCVKSADGAPEKGARVLVNGLDHDIQLTSYTGEDGCYALDVRAQAQLSISAQSEAALGGPLVLRSSASLVSAEVDPGACQEVSTITMQPLADSDCGHGLSECGGVCVDTNFDADHCGTCGTVCEVTSCVSAQCASPDDPGEPVEPMADAGPQPMDASTEPDAASDRPDASVGTRLLAVSSSGSGLGSVTSTPAGIQCSTCQVPFPHGTTVTLQATPDSASSSFAGWGGECSAAGVSDCSLTLDVARSATAVFQLLPRALIVNVTGDTMGKVSGLLAATEVISCGSGASDCSETLDHGTAVTLTAYPMANTTFAWGGACAGVFTASCTVTMNAARTATITFSPIQYTLTVHSKDLGQAPPQGFGTVTMPSPATGFSCANSAGTLDMVCTQTFNAGTQVTLHAAPQGPPYNAFYSWADACAGFTTAQDCVITMNGNLTATANFVGVIL